jgi:hypothetical protein
MASRCPHRCSGLGSPCLWVSSLSLAPWAQSCRLSRRFCHQVFGFICVGKGVCVVALARVCAPAVVVGGCIARRDLDDLAVVRDCAIGITSQPVCDCTIVIGSRVVGATLENLRAALDPQLRLLALEAVLFVVSKNDRRERRFSPPTPERVGPKPVAPKDACPDGPLTPSGRAAKTMVNASHIGFHKNPGRPAMADARPRAGTHNPEKSFSRPTDIVNAPDMTRTQKIEARQLGPRCRTALGVDWRRNAGAGPERPGSEPLGRNP